MVLLPIPMLSSPSPSTACASSFHPFSPSSPAACAMAFQRQDPTMTAPPARPAGPRVSPSAVYAKTAPHSGSVLKMTVASDAVSLVNAIVSPRPVTVVEASPVQSIVPTTTAGPISDASTEPHSSLSPAVIDATAAVKANFSAPRPAPSPAANATPWGEGAVSNTVVIGTTRSPAPLLPPSAMASCAAHTRAKRATTDTCPAVRDKASLGYWRPKVSMRQNPRPKKMGWSRLRKSFEVRGGVPGPISKRATPKEAPTAAITARRGGGSPLSRSRKGTKSTQSAQMKALVPALEVCRLTAWAVYAKRHHTPVSAPANKGLKRLLFGLVAIARGNSTAVAMLKRTAMIIDGGKQSSKSFTHPKFVPYTALTRRSNIRAC
mmetsp:Transcript_76645/g.150261  ORF Transcript_76645/g.150261 Transcript_76645/m.150261 type:complete len:377 (-) Transcript_76645:530-1660(-)